MGHVLRIVSERSRLHVIAPESELPRGARIARYRFVSKGKRFESDGIILRHLRFVLGAIKLVPCLAAGRFRTIYGFGLAGAVIGACVSLLTGGRLVLDLFETDFPEYYRTSWGSWPVLKVARWGAGFVLRRASTIFVLSQTMAHEQRRRFPGRVHVVYDGADRDFTRIDAREGGAADGEPTLVFHGGIESRDGVEVLLDAASDALQRSRFRLIVLGRGRAFTNCVERVRRDARLRDAVVIPGWIPYERIFGYLAGAHVGVIPSLDVPVNRRVPPRKIFEYQAAGIPVIASDLEPIREVAVGKATIFVRPGDSSSLAHAMVRVSEECEALEHLLQAARRERTPPLLDDAAEMIAANVTGGAAGGREGKG